MMNWASSGSGLGQLRSPTGIAIDPAGYILVLDAGNARVDVFGLGGLEALFHFGTEGHDVGQFFHPAAIAVDPDGRILVMDKDNHRVQVFVSVSSPVMPVTWSRIKMLVDP